MGVSVAIVFVGVLALFSWWLLENNAKGRNGKRHQPLKPATFQNFGRKKTSDEHKSTNKMTVAIMFLCHALWPCMEGHGPRGLVHVGLSLKPPSYLSQLTAVVLMHVSRACLARRVELCLGCSGVSTNCGPPVANLRVPTSMHRPPSELPHKPSRSVPCDFVQFRWRRTASEHLLKSLVSLWSHIVMRSSRLVCVYPAPQLSSRVYP